MRNSCEDAELRRAGRDAGFGRLERELLGAHDCGIKNILEALEGRLTYYDRKRERTIGISPSNTVIFTRPRGLHIHQEGILPGELLPASLFDVAMVAYQVDFSALKHPLCFYIPKSESADEALWWRDLFQTLAT